MRRRSRVNSLKQAQNILGLFLKLPDNWNSYGAAAINPSAVREANIFLRGYYEDNPGIKLTIVPTNKGGVLITDASDEKTIADFRPDKDGEIT